MIPRLFTPLELSQDAVVPLDEAASHHASRVLRLGSGAPVLPRHVELRLEEVARNRDFLCGRYSVVR